MIVCSRLTKRFGSRTGVKDLNLDLPQGSLCVLLGPNGAGKSTTLKLLTGQLRPDEGTIQVGGLDVGNHPEALARIIGVLPDRLGLFDHLTVEEHLLLAGRLHGLPEPEIEARAEHLLRVLDLEQGRWTFADHASHGMRKKTALALALVHGPRVLFLDEPFEGVDPATVRIIHDLLQAVAARGVTVFFTSHSLSLAERIATHAVLLRDGREIWNRPASEVPDTLEALYFDLIGGPQAQDLPWLGSARS